MSAGMVSCSTGSSLAVRWTPYDWSMGMGASVDAKAAQLLDCRLCLSNHNDGVSVPFIRMSCSITMLVLVRISPSCRAPSRTSCNNESINKPYRPLSVMRPDNYQHYIPTRCTVLCIVRQTHAQHYNQTIQMCGFRISNIRTRYTYSSGVRLCFEAVRPLRFSPWEALRKNWLRHPLFLGRVTMGHLADCQ